MERTRFIEHRGRPIVLLDFAGIIDPAVALLEIEKAKEFFARQDPDGSLLTLTDTTGARYNMEIIEAMKHLTVHNRPYVKAAAIVTDSGLHRVAIMAVAKFSGRRLQAFGGLEEAEDWLVEQAG